MKGTRKVRRRARAHARALELQVLRSQNTRSSIAQRPVAASCAGPSNEVSLRRQIDRTTEEAMLCNSVQIMNERTVVPDLEANCSTTNIILRLYQYQVHYVPDVFRSQTRKQILAEAYKDKLKGYISDGTMLFTATHIPVALLTTLINAEDDFGAAQTLTITLRLVDTEQFDFHLPHAFPTIVHKCLELLKLQAVGRNSVAALAAVRNPNYRIELQPGYFITIRLHQSQIQIGYEISQRFMLKANILHLLLQCIRQDAVNYKDYCGRLIVGSIVLAEYNKQTYRIDDIDWEKTIQSTFRKRDGTSVSYKDYYMQKYKVNISFNSQPLLISRAKPRELRAGMSELIYLVPELCQMTGLYDNERSNTQMMRTLTPDDRICRFKSYKERMQTYTTESGCITRAYVSNGRVLMKRVYTWVVMCPEHLKQDTINFVNSLHQFASCMAMNMPQPTIQGIDNDRPATYLDGLDYVITRFNPQLILCVINNNKSDRYSAIKKKCCVDRGVASQVLLRKNMINKNIISLATQIYCTLGGIPWTVEIPVSHLMVVGLHVSLDTIDESKSYGVMVSSFDLLVTRYLNMVATHSNEVELSKKFTMNITKTITKYQEENNGRLPDHIIIYRNGIKDCHASEISGIRTILEILYHWAGKPLKLGFIIITKYMSTEILRALGNLHKRYDFMIVSQLAEQETVSPVHCHVIHDTLGFPPEHLQTITWKLAYMYYTRSCATRLPAPCLYAHRLAHLVSHTLHSVPNPRLNKTLHYL